MNRRAWLRSVATIPFAGGATSAQAVRKPSLLVFVIDPGAALPPGLTSFPRAYTANPEADPALASVLTGRFSHASGVARNGSALPASTKCLASALRSAGYRTVYTGGWPLRSAGPVTHGFDSWLRDGSVESVAKFARQDPRPFFAQVDCRGGSAKDWMQELRPLGTIAAAVSLHGRESGLPLESSVRVRFGISGVPDAAAADLLISHVDLMPSLLGMAGVPVPAETQGRDLSALLAGGRGSRPESIFVHGNLGRPEEWRMVVRGLDKLVVNQAMQTTHLYNLGQDSGEENNLAADAAYQRTRDELTAHLVQWMRRIGDRMDPSGLKVRG
jgi:arylsulfatase A-like enzyme